MRAILPPCSSPLGPWESLPPWPLSSMKLHPRCSSLTSSWLLWRCLWFYWISLSPHEWFPSLMVRKFLWFEELKETPLRALDLWLLELLSLKTAMTLRCVSVSLRVAVFPNSELLAAGNFLPRSSQPPGTLLAKQYPSSSCLLSFSLAMTPTLTPDYHYC